MVHEEHGIAALFWTVLGQFIGLAVRKTKVYQNIFLQNSLAEKVNC